MRKPKQINPVFLFALAGIGGFILWKLLRPKQLQAVTMPVTVTPQPQPFAAPQQPPARTPINDAFDPFNVEILRKAFEPTPIIPQDYVLKPQIEPMGDDYTTPEEAQNYFEL